MAFQDAKMSADERKSISVLASLGYYLITATFLSCRFPTSDYLATVLDDAKHVKKHVDILLSDLDEE